MRLTKIIGLVLLLTNLCGGEASADAIWDTMADIGLTGRWAPDCSKGYWKTYRLDPSGQVFSDSHTNTYDATARVIVAERLGETRIRLVYEHVSSTTDYPTVTRYPKVEVIEERLGDKFRTMYSRVLDNGAVVVKDGRHLSLHNAPTPLFEKCIAPIGELPPATTHRG